MRQGGQVVHCLAVNCMSDLDMDWLLLQAMDQQKHPAAAGQKPQRASDGWQGPGHHLQHGPTHGEHANLSDAHTALGWFWCKCVIGVGLEFRIDPFLVDCSALCYRLICKLAFSRDHLLL